MFARKIRAIDFFGGFLALGGSTLLVVRIIVHIVVSPTSKELICRILIVSTYLGGWRLSMGLCTCYRDLGRGCDHLCRLRPLAVEVHCYPSHTT